MTEYGMNLASNEGIHVSRSAEEANAEAAEFIRDLAKKAVAARGMFTIALSGGSTPKKLYALMASDEYREQFPWEKIEFFWGDERYVPSTDASSNFHMTQEAMLSKAPVSPERIHRVRTELPPEEAAGQYEDEVRRIVRLGENRCPAFDLVLLGLGTNGHTASLFPFQRALHEHERLVVSEYIDEVKMTRTTFTVPLINSAREILFISLGADKASVLKDVITGPYVPDKLPAQFIRPEQGRLTWLIDRDAASGLPKEILRKK